MHIFILILTLVSGNGGTDIERIEIKDADYKVASEMCVKGGDNFHSDIEQFSTSARYTCIYAGVK